MREYLSGRERRDGRTGHSKKKRQFTKVTVVGHKCHALLLFPSSFLPILSHEAPP